MKPGSLTFLCSMMLWYSLQSTPDVSMEVYRFNAESSAYIELSLYVVGISLLNEAKNEAEYGVEYIVLIKDESADIVNGNRYKLSRKGYPAQDIIDIKRYSLPPGHYTIEVEVNDLADQQSKVSISQEVEISAEKPVASLSDIQLLAALKNEPEESSPFHKSGLYLEPLPFRFYYPALSLLCVYLEVYNAGMLEGQPYLQYTIKPESGNLPAPMVTYKKVNKEDIAANVLQLDISKLISGYYILETALFDGNRELKEVKKLIFSRLNPIGDSIFLETSALDIVLGFASGIPEDSLDYDIRAMAPIVYTLDMEVMNALLKKGSSKAKRYFIHRYWTTQSGKFAGPAFHSYMKVARVVDDNYRSGFGYGFETDRGHVFLKYGKPDEVITVEDEPSAPPYEIWFYTTFPATHQNNVRFLFYNPSLTTNGFELLHSTARGEVNNARWEVDLYRDATQETPGVNEKEMGDNVHRNARTYFQN